MKACNLIKGPGHSILNWRTSSACNSQMAFLSKYYLAYHLRKKMYSAASETQFFAINYIFGVLIARQILKILKALV